MPLNHTFQLKAFFSQRTKEQNYYLNPVCLTKICQIGSHWMKRSLFCRLYNQTRILWILEIQFSWHFFQNNKRIYRKSKWLHNKLCISLLFTFEAGENFKRQNNSVSAKNASNFSLFHFVWIMKTAEGTRLLANRNRPCNWKLGNYEIINLW